MSDDVVTFWSTPWLYKFPFSIDEDGTVWTDCSDSSSEWCIQEYGLTPVFHGPLPAPMTSPLRDSCF